MKKIFSILTLLGLLFSSTTIIGQHQAVSFDYEKASFNNNQPLPAESHILVQGDVPKNVTIIELSVFDGKGREDRKPLYTVLWKKPFDKEAERFNLPVNYKLRGSSEYDFKMSFFTPISKEERKALAQQVSQHLDTYIEQTFSVNKSSIKLTNSSRQIMNDLNEIVFKGMEHYRNRTNIGFDGFSDIVKQTLQRIEKANLNKGRFLFIGKNKDEARAEYRNKLTKELKSIMFSELDQIFNTDLAKLSDSRFINDYSTEKTQRTLAIQGGYGGTYVDGTFSNLKVGNGPYLGLAFPLGNRTFAPKILSNTSITFGAYLTNFKNIGQNNGDVSGPIFKRPTYVGLSYKIYQFIRFNASAVFLEDASTAGQISGLGSRVFIRPSIGLSLQINLWADLSR